ncbi:MAG: carboxymuconolactone decarboxylase family protein [Mucilaginibacter sp.]
MKQRINFFEKAKDAMAAMYGLGAYLQKSSIDQRLLELIYFRVSQVNGCAYCLDMHSKDLRVKGETEARLYVLNAWREAPFYSERERAALAWAEAITKAQVPDSVFEETRLQFSEEEMIDLTIAAITINCYNRINIAFPSPSAVGSYQPGMYSE